MEGNYPTPDNTLLDEILDEIKDDTFLTQLDDIDHLLPKNHQNPKKDQKKNKKD